MKALLMLPIFCMSALAAEHPERWYQERIATAMKGEMEVAVADGRVDLVTAEHAIEVEFAGKWKQAIGQALWYALQTDKKPGIVLILEDEKRDSPRAIRLGSVIAEHKLPIQVWLWPRDFHRQNG